MDKATAVETACDEADDATGIGDWLARERPSARLNRLLFADAPSVELDESEILLKDEVLGVARPFDSTLHGLGTIDLRRYFPTARDLLHVYGPAGRPAQPDPDSQFAYSWVSGDAPFASPSTRVSDGKFWAGQYSAGGYAQALAGVGVRLLPTLAKEFTLSVRPYVQFDGSSVLSGRTFDAPGGPARSTAWGSVGIFVESWAIGGGAHHVDADHFVQLWEHSAPNPRESRSYGDSVSSRDGLTVDVFANGERRYKIWVYCWVETQGQNLAQATAYAGSSISCWMPYLVVQETPV